MGLIMHLSSLMEIIGLKCTPKCAKYIEIPLLETFLDTLRSFTDHKMWDFMHLHNDEE